MAASKPRTTMAKLNRERRLVEKRHQKQLRKAARKQAAADEAVADDVAGVSDERAPDPL